MTWLVLIKDFYLFRTECVILMELNHFVAKLEFFNDFYKYLYSLENNLNNDYLLKTEFTNVNIDGEITVVRDNIEARYNDEG